MLPQTAGRPVWLSSGVGYGHRVLQGKAIDGHEGQRDRVAELAGRYLGCERPSARLWSWC
jgi:hypothetical protein